MSQCDHTWVMDDSPRPACHKCFMERDACALADRIATLERELAEMLRDWTEDVNKCERVERELAAVTAERDALKAGKWAGPWEQVGHEWHRANSRGLVAEASLLRPTAHRADVRWFWEVRGSDDDAICATADEAKAAADAALLAAGWYLAPAPPTKAPRHVEEHDGYKSYCKLCDEQWPCAGALQNLQPTD